MMISGQQVAKVLKVHQAVYAKNRLERVAAGNKPDVLELSNQAQVLKNAQDLVLKSAEVRADKIVELKKQINEGTYQITGTEIATKIIERSLVDELAGR